MKLISRIVLIMTAAAGIIFIILGICMMGMSGSMTNVMNEAANRVTEETSTISIVESVTENGDIFVPEVEVLPEYTQGGVISMLIVGIFLLLYGIGSTVVSIISLNKLEKAKTKKDIKLFAILACIFSFVAPGVFLLRLTDEDIRDKKEIEDRRR